MRSEFFSSHFRSFSLHFSTREKNRFVSFRSQNSPCGALSSPSCRRTTILTLCGASNAEDQYRTEGARREPLLQRLLWR